MDASIELDANTVTPCVRDDFDDLEATGWTVLNGMWTVTAGTGRDGSPAIVAGGAGNHTITPAAASEYRSGRIAIDFRIDGATRGDFVVYLYKNPMIEFSVAIHPIESDNPTDTIRRSDQGSRDHPEPAQCQHERGHVASRRDRRSKRRRAPAAARRDYFFGAVSPRARSPSLRTSVWRSRSLIGRYARVVTP